MGADVIKIDTPMANDGEGPVRRQRSSHTNRNKRSVALNLKSNEGCAIFSELANTADVVIEGFRPGVMKKLGIDYPKLALNNDRLIYCSLSGFGQSGPYRDRPAHDLNFLALSGVIDLMSSPGKVPDIPLNLVADFGGGAMHAALAIAFALLGRAVSGAGQFIDISYFDSTLALLAATPSFRHLHSSPKAPRGGEGIFCGGYPYYALYRTKDGKLLSVACTETHIWSRFCAAIAMPELVKFGLTGEHYLRAPNEAERHAKDAISAVISLKSCMEWEGFFSVHDVCVAPVKSVSEVLADPQVLSRGFVTSVRHPADGSLPQFESALRLSKTPGTIRGAAPMMGEHTDQVLASLGIPHKEIERLRSRGVAA